MIKYAQRVVASYTKANMIDFLNVATAFAISAGVLLVIIKFGFLGIIWLVIAGVILYP